MVSSVHGISHMDSQDLVGLICHPPIATTSIFWHNQSEVVVKLVLPSEPLHVLTIHGKVLLFTLCNKSFLVFFCQVVVCIEGVCLVPPTLHKLALVGPPNMRDDLNSYLLPLLL
jgi:hypothetical protein